MKWRMHIMALKCEISANFKLANIKVIWLLEHNREVYCDWLIVCKLIVLLVIDWLSQLVINRILQFQRYVNRKLFLVISWCQPEHTLAQTPLVQIISRKFVFAKTNMKINLACVGFAILYHTWSNNENSQRAFDSFSRQPHCSNHESELFTISPRASLWDTFLCK